jgi:hypothetical protein
MSESRAWSVFFLLCIGVYLWVQFNQPKPTVQPISLPIAVSSCPAQVLDSVRLEVLSPIRSDELRLRLEGESKRIRIAWQNSSLSVNSADSCQAGVCRVALPSTAPNLLEVQLDDCPKVLVNP